MKIEIVEGDITEVAADAIVNAANTALALGAGVAGAIRRQGGPAIQQECRQLAPIPLGEAVVTSAGNLAHTRHVIHAAAMHPGGQASAESVALATAAALREAERIGAQSVALPALGMGIGGLDLETGATVMLAAVRAHAVHSLQRVVFVLFAEPAAVFRRHLAAP